MSDDGSGGSPPPPQRRIKKVMVLSSGSEEESDDSGGPRLPRKRKLRVVSDEEGSESSGSSVVQAGVRRKRALPKLRDSDDSDTSGWATDHSDSKVAPAPVQGTSGFASDSSEGNSDKCSICLMRFTNQEIGIPQNCEHVFCVDCITEWSKNVNTCPVDRIAFDNIIVRACLGGRVLRTESVKIVERRPSVDLLVIEDPTACEICGSSESEDSMLLCDSCDLGFHMHCLTPPLLEIPLDQWFCPSCAADGAEDDFLYLSEVEDLLTEVADESPPHGPRPTPLRARRSPLPPARRSNRNRSHRSEPSTSATADNLPTTSRGTWGSATTTTRRRKPTRRRKRRTHTVIIEYEIQDGCKFPVTKRVTKRVKRRRTKKRQPRTAARRAHVRASVRAILSRGATCTEGDQIESMRSRAGIPTLRLFGARDELEYFSDEEGGDDGQGVAVRAHRPTSEVLHAYRQARRKMISMPSPPHASAAPDLLSDILNSQTLLHSKHAKTTLTSDGRLDITLKADKLDLTKKSDEAAKKAPGYGGGGRSGGWGGGYRGNYHRQQGVNSFRDYNSSGPPRQNNDHPYRDNARDDEIFGSNNYQQHPFGPADRPLFDRNRRANDREQNFHRNDQNRSGIVQYATPEPPRPERPITARHSFGGFDNPVDMRVGQENSPLSLRQGISFQPLPEPPSFKFGPIPEGDQPLPKPPSFKFGPTPVAEKDEDEDLVIDTDKYDPTEPTNDDDDDNDNNVSMPPAISPTNRTSHIPTPPLPPPELLACLEATNINVPPTVLDTAVRQVLQEHRDLMAGPQATRDRSDEDSDGDCPNFSIYSATSFHIANSSDVNNDQAGPGERSPAVPAILDEDIPFPEPDSHEIAPTENVEQTQLSTIVKASATSSKVVDLPKKDAEEQYKEKVSKRCPITTNTRNPIKIKLNTPSLIKRVSLYDEEDMAIENEPSENREFAEKTITTENVKSPEIIKEKQETYEEKQKSASPEPTKEGEFDVIEISSPEKRKSDSPEPTKEDELDVIELSTTKKQKSASPEPTKKDGFDGSELSTLEKQKSVSPVPTIGDGFEVSELTSPERLDASPKPAEEEKDELIENNYLRSITTFIEDVTRDENSDNEAQSEEELDISKESKDKTEETIEKMTESISETEDERSYTPCLDENKSKDNSFETEKDKGLYGLDTEMISEDEGNEMFSDNEQTSEKAISEVSQRSPSLSPTRIGREEGEIDDGKKEQKEDSSSDRGKKKKKKESKKEGKDKKSKKKSDTVFKKVKGGKDRNYRERDKEEKLKKKDKRDSSSDKERQKKKREKRKELERYDVRAVVSEKRKKLKDQFGRDISPQNSDSATSPQRRASLSPSPVLRPQTPPRRSVSRPRKSISRRRSGSRGRRSVSRVRRSLSRGRRSVSRIRRSPSPRIRRSRSRGEKSVSRRHTPRRSPSPRRRRSRSRRRSASRGRVTPMRRKSPLRLRHSPSPPPPRRRSLSPIPARRRRKSPSPRRRSESRGRRKKHRSPSPKPKKKKKRARSGSKARKRSPPARSPKKKRARKSASAAPVVDTQWSPDVDSGLLSPRTPPPEPPVEQEPPRRRRRRDDRSRHKRRDVAAPSKEVFTSGDNILVSVSFKDQEENAEVDSRRKRRIERRKRRRRRLSSAQAVTEHVKPVAIIDLERSPFREITPSPKNVIVLSDSDHNDKENDNRNVQEEKSASEPVKENYPVSVVVVGPKTPPEPVQFTIPAKPQPPRLPNPLRDDEPSSELNVDEESPPRSPDAYDPFEPTRSPSPPPAVAPTPQRQQMTLEAAQRTNMSADDVIDTAPISPIEKVMALLQSTRDVSPEPPPSVGGPGGPSDSLPPPAAPAPIAPAPPVRIVLPSPTRAQSKLLATKPSPIKSNPIKPLQSTNISKLPMPPRRADSDMGGDSPYSPGSYSERMSDGHGEQVHQDLKSYEQYFERFREQNMRGSSDFGDLFEPPSAGGGGGGNKKKDTFDSLFGSVPRRRHKPSVAKVPVKLSKKKGKTQVGVKIDEANLKILEELPSSAVEMEVKSKFLKKLNRQERVVEEVKLVLKPHYNKKRITKEEYKQIMRRAVPKICHNKTGEINPAKISALVEAYVKKFRKKHKLGLA